MVQLTTTALTGLDSLMKVPHGRVDVNSEHCQIVDLQSRTTDTEEKFRLGSLNVGTMAGRAGKVVETLPKRKFDVCLVQEISWRDASVRMISGKDSEYDILGWKNL